MQEMKGGGEKKESASRIDVVRKRSISWIIQTLKHWSRSTEAWMALLSRASAYRPLGRTGARSHESPTSYLMPPIHHPPLAEAGDTDSRPTRGRFPCGCSFADRSFANKRALINPAISRFSTRPDDLDLTFRCNSRVPLENGAWRSHAAIRHFLLIFFASRDRRRIERATRICLSSNTVWNFELSDF